MRLESIDAATRELLTFVPQTLSQRSNYQLDRINAFLDGLGRPQNAVPVVHVAGTSGKTSTAYFIRNQLQAAGRRTGLTVSPHISSITERVQVDGRPLDDEIFLELLGRFLDLVRDSGVPLTYFEVLVAFAYWAFAESEVDYAVVEVGLGGLLDGTNVVSRPDKVAVITDLGLDHTEILGDTIEAIAVQKAGIIGPGNEAFMLDQGPDITAVVAREAAARGGRLHVVDGSDRPAAAGLPPFQRRNWAIAAAVYEFVARRDGLAARAGEPGDGPPGRMDRRTVRGRPVVLDGAHNPLREALVDAGLTQLAVMATFVQSPPGKLDAALAELAPVTRHLVVPEFAVIQDLAKASFPAAEVARRAEAAGIRSVQICRDLPSAFDALLGRPEPDLLVTGSLYLVSQVLATTGE
jgi:dihydrofolate synthase / folylpolyglutamate synthase